MRPVEGNPRVQVIMIEMLRFISSLLQLYVYVLIASAVFSWLMAFNVINRQSPVVNAIGTFLYQVTEPILRRVRAFLPNFGGLDISPVFVILVIFFIQSVLLPNIARAIL
jgi:YggT family protein